jgi:transcription antitermination factor NusG
VNFDPITDIWYPLCHTFGVKRLFSNYIINKDKSYSYLKPIPVPDNMIEQLQTQAIQPKNKTVTVIQKGLICKVTSGIFEGREGICHWSDNKRTELLMDVMNGKIHISFSTDTVELA